MIRNMSRIRAKVELEPPFRMNRGKNREVMVSAGHKCGYCQGNGWTWKAGAHPPGEAEREECPVCDGTGQLDAVVTVDWRPTGKEV